MTEVDNTSRAKRAAGVVEFRVDADLQNLAVLRTLIGAVGTLEDLDFDAVADLRLAVDEACTRLIRSAAPDSELVVVVHPGADELVVKASAPCTDPEVLTPGSFSWHVLKSLTDDVSTFEDSRPDVADAPWLGIALSTRRAKSVS